MMSVASVATPDVKAALKRSLSDLEADTKSPLSGQPPAKRPKVQFSSDNKVFTLKNWDDDKTLSLVREEVRRALEKHAARESSLYDGLREILTIKPTATEAPSSTLLKRYMVAITGLCSVMGRKGGALVKSITEMHWLGRDEEFVVLYRRLLANIISTYGGYSHEILGSLVDRFMTLRPSSGRLPKESIIRRPEMLERIHGTIEHILQKVPSAISELQIVLRQSFPHTTDSLKEHMDYVTSILRVASYTQFIKADIVATIFDKLTVMDTNMQQDILDLEEELQEHLEQDLSQEISLLIEKDNDNDADGAELSDSDEESEIDEFEDPNKRRLHTLKQQVAKLDGMMELMFTHFEPSFSKAGIDEQFSVLDQMFGMFARMILPTNKTRFVQFLLFHYAQTSEQLSDRFVQALITVLVDRDADKMVKRSAAAYLASFIARGARVTRSLVENTFYTLGAEMDRLRLMHEKNEGCGPDINRFGTYYTIFQCLMYIFCFRWRDLTAHELEDDQFDTNDLAWGRDVVDTFRRNISSKLNPLKVCAQPIVNQFAIVVRQLQILFLEPKLEQNKRIRLTRSMFSVSGGFSILAEKENAMSNKIGEQQYQLDAYFPFDPYNLPLSKRWIEGEYNVWRPVPGTEFEEENESDSEVEDEVVEEEDVYDEPTETESIGSRR
jgi:RNA polymerase I-specific transcription initiation factor RRN3